MRFVSQYPAYGLQVRPQRVEPLGDGTSRVVQEPLYITFTAVDDGAMIYEKERYQADQHFKFHGSQQHADEATPVDTIHRLSIFDTDEVAQREGWSDEDKALVEETLARKSQTTPNAVLLIEGKPIEAPFPVYDRWDGTPEALVLRCVENGFDLEQVLFYERSHGPQRPSVIAALEEGIEQLKDLVVRA